MLSLPKKGTKANETRPILTFGIFYKVNDLDSLQHAAKVLYLLEYLDVSAFIAKSIDSYTDAFKLTSSQLQKMLADTFATKISRMFSVGEENLMGDKGCL